VAGPLRAGDRGSGLSPGLAVRHAELVLRKGFRPEIDSYSAFRENNRRTPTGLAAYLRERGFERLSLCGLATD
jgi:nicotinamidase/pyrazinamidase